MNRYEVGRGVIADADKAVLGNQGGGARSPGGDGVDMEDVYRNGRLGRRIDEERAKTWARRLGEANSAQKCLNIATIKKRC